MVHVRRRSTAIVMATSGILVVSLTVAFTITNSSGKVVFQGAHCVSSGGVGETLTGVSCEADWNTAAPEQTGGAVTAGTYTLVATDTTGSTVVLEANFTLG